MKRINEIFKPSKITISGKAKIIDTKSGKYVLKEKNKDIKSLYDYLESRKFLNYPSIVDEYDKTIVYEYINDIKTPINQKAADMASTLSSLHNKTSYYKTIAKDDIKALYEMIKGNINYFDNHLKEIYDLSFMEEYMKPSHYLIMRNQSRLISLVDFLNNEVELWYKLVIDNTKERVVYCHNNLSIDHYINNNFVSWDNYIIDSPVLDLINLYHNDFDKYDFSNFFNVYFSKMELLEEEKKLLFLVLSIPENIYFNDNEMDNTIMAGKLIDYIDKTEKLIRPYYSVENPE